MPAHFASKRLEYSRMAFTRLAVKYRYLYYLGGKQKTEPVSKIAGFGYKVDMTTRQIRTIPVYGMA